MSVFSLVEHQGRETNELLANLSEIAKQEGGGSLLLVYKSPAGRKLVASTGVYKADPSKALRAAMQISIALTKEEESWRGRP